jgi:hypothetical protein
MDTDCAKSKLVVELLVSLERKRRSLAYHQMSLLSNLDPRPSMVNNLQEPAPVAKAVRCVRLSSLVELMTGELKLLLLSTPKAD